LPLIPFTGEKRLNIIGSRARKVEWQVKYQIPRKSQSGLVLKPMPLFLRREIQPDIPIVDQYSDEMVFV
jgi:hypothetical protein